MATTIITKNGSGAPLAGDLQVGELAIDLTNKKLYSKEGTTVFEVGATGGGAAGTFTDLTATNSFTSVGIDDNATSTAITIDSNGDLGVGTTNPLARLHTYVSAATVGETDPVARFERFTTGDNHYLDIAIDNDNNLVSFQSTGSSDGAFTFGGTSSERMRIDASGNVGIGTTSPASLLELEGTDPIITLDDTSAGGYAQVQALNGSLILMADEGASVNNSIVRFDVDGTERMRIDSSGKVGINTSTMGSAAGSLLTLSGTSASYTQFNAGTSGGGAVGTEGNGLAFYSYSGNLGSETYTKRMTLDSSGNLLVGQTSASTVVDGAYFRTNGSGFIATSTDCLMLNRQGTDGTVLDIRHANTTEGSISVSGTTVSYNGGHLSRWSQSDIDDVSAIYKGTVMSNLDEMCEWDNEDNEQLNKTKVSDVEGDVNVAGVFVAKDSSDDLSDYYLAMTGDMIIRIAQGTTVQRGDLLMSAGDGTAKPQDDDIVRSKTIAKVTSTNVTCTYADGSYCVPCVLMAC